MPPPLATPERLTAPHVAWIFACAALPHVYATRDLSRPATPGGPFDTGDSAGGSDSVGGGAGPDALQAWGRITAWPTVTRRISDLFIPVVEVQTVTLKVAALLDGDYCASPFTLSRYDETTGLRLYEFTGVITRTVVDRDGTTIEGANVDRALLETLIPTRTITTTEFPLAVSDAVGTTPAWLFGNVTNLPLPNVRDDPVHEQFDYLLCRGTAAGLAGVRRVIQGGVVPFVSIGFIELEPFPGGRVLLNGTMETWSSSTVAASWTLAGAGASIAKNQTAGQFDEGHASLALTRVGANCTVSQDLVVSAAEFGLPLSWWRGRTITLTGRTRATSANRARIFINDGTTNRPSEWHSGSGAFETQAVTLTLSNSLTSVSVGGAVMTGDTTAQFDDLRVYLQAKSWEDVLRTDLYAGYTALRFYLRQEESSGALYQLVADVNGLQPERNLVRAARTLLTDATHGLGRTVDAASFDAAEFAVAKRYEDYITRLTPQVLITFDRIRNFFALPASFTLADFSGHLRPATVTNVGACSVQAGISPALNVTTDFALGVTDASSVTVPYTTAYDPTALGHTLEIWYRPFNATEVGERPIVEKLVGAAQFSGLCLRSINSLITYVVNASGGVVVVDLPLTSADTDHDLYLCGRAVGGVATLTIGRNGVLTTSAEPYTGTLPSGDGVVLCAKSGTGSIATSNGVFDNLAVYNYALSDAEVAANARAYLIPADASGGEASLPSGFVDAIQNIQTNIDPLAIYHYRLAELSGATMTDSGTGGGGAPVNGTYTGSPLLGATGPLNPLSIGVGVEDTQISFDNKFARFGTVAGQTYSGTQLGVLAWYTPDALSANSAIAEKTIGGVVNTSFNLFQEGATIVFRVKPTTTAFVSLSYQMTEADVGRPMCLLGTYDTGVLRLCRNGVLVAETTYTSPVAVGVGDFFVGKLGGAIYPTQGDVGQVVIFDGYAPSSDGELSPETGQDDAATLFLWGTHVPGGRLVDLAMTEPRPALDWLTQVGQLLGLRLDFTAAGTITCSVDATPPAVIQYDARDGAGDGERTLVDIGGRQRPGLDDRVRDVVVKYRRDLLSGTYLFEARRAVSTRLDANGRRIGRDKEFQLDAVREHTAADRFADYAAKILAADEHVEVTLHQEARRLRESDLVQTTDALMGYASEVLRVRELRKALATIEATLWQYDEDVYVYTPAALPVRGTSG